MKNESVFVWRKSVDISNRIYRITPLFPSNDINPLAKKLQKAALKASSLLSTGISLCSNQASQKYCRKAVKALSEIECLLIFSHRAHIMEEEDVNRLINDIDSVRMQIIHFLGYLDRKLNPDRAAINKDPSNMHGN